MPVQVKNFIASRGNASKFKRESNPLESVPAAIRRFERYERRMRLAELTPYEGRARTNKMYHGMLLGNSDRKTVLGTCNKNFDYEDMKGTLRWLRE